MRERTHTVSMFPVYPMMCWEVSIQITERQEELLTFPQDRLDLGLPLDVHGDSDLGGGPGRWLAGVLSAVLQLDVVDDQAGPVAASAVSLQLLHQARLPSVKLEDLNSE